MDDHIGGIGVSGPHVKGVNAQRKLAISRAVDEIARQMEVRVKNMLKVIHKGNRDSVHTRHQSYSIQTVGGQTITAKIKDMWQNPETNELYVWMVVK